MTRPLVFVALLFVQGAAQTGRFTISGQILSNGKPAGGVRVSAVEANDSGLDQAGLDQALLASVTQTDDAGRYRLDSVPPGRYHILAGSLALPTFFPGAADRADARFVVVSPGARLESVDFSMADLWCGTPPKVTRRPQPLTIAANRLGDVFFAELDTSTVHRIDPDGKVTVVAANSSSLAGAPLRSVSALAADGAGNLYIAEKSSPRIRKVTPAGAISTVAGNGMTGGISGDGGPATSASLCPPTGLAVDGAGNLFIASGQADAREANDFRVRKVDTAGIISTVAGAGTLPVREPVIQTNPFTFSDLLEGGLATAGPVLPTRIAADTLGNLYVGSDTLTGVGRFGVRRVTSAGVIETVAGTSTGPGAGLPQFNSMESVSGVAVDVAGNLFFAGIPMSSCETISKPPWPISVRRIAPSGTITTVAGYPTQAGGKCTQVGPDLNLPLFQSFGNFIAIDGPGNLFISEFDSTTSTASIRKISPEGKRAFFYPAAIPFPAFRTATVSGQLASAIPPDAYAERGFESSSVVPAPPNATFYLVPKNGDGLDEREESMHPSMNAPTNGRFTLQVWPGSYELFVSLPDIQGWGTAQPGAALKPLAFGRTSLEVRGNITGVAVTVRPGVDLKGRVTVDGRPASAGGFQIRLQPDAQAAKILAYQSIERFRPAIGADGSFVFPALPEARYEVRVETTGQASLSVADIQIDGKSVIGKSIAIGATSPGLLEIALKTESGK